MRGEASSDTDSYRGAGTRIDILYRRAATGLCFLVFMVSALPIALLLLPALHLVPGRRRRSHLRLAVVHLSFKAFTWFMCFMRVMRRFEVSGPRPDPDDGPRVYIANHPTLIDVVTMIGRVPRCNCIVKGELFRHRFMGGVLRGAGMIPNAGGPELLERVEQAIADGQSLMIFPEGTRSPLNGLHPFNRGAARLVLHMNLPVVPVSISCTPPTLQKGTTWRDTPPRAVTFQLRFHPVTHPGETIDETLPMPRRVRALTRTWQQFYAEDLGLDSAAADGTARTADGARGAAQGT